MCIQNHSIVYCLEEQKFYTSLFSQVYSSLLVCLRVYFLLLFAQSPVLDRWGPERHGKALSSWAGSGHEAVVSGAKRIITRSVSYGVTGLVVPRPIVQGQDAKFRQDNEKRKLSFKADPSDREVSAKRVQTGRKADKPRMIPEKIIQLQILF